MAIRTETVTTDDITGEPGARTIAFALDGVSYEIDLGEKNFAKMNEDFAAWIGHARKATGKTRGAAKNKAKSETKSEVAGGDHDHDPKTVRAWAAEHGVKVAPRGRIPGEVVEQFRSATAA